MKQIKIQVARGENFTPNSLMRRYAKETGAIFSSTLWGESELLIEGRAYTYHHWGITAEKGVETVTLFLEEVIHHGS